VFRTDGRDKAVPEYLKVVRAGGGRLKTFTQQRAATAWLATEKHFRRIMGYQHLWILKAYLDDAECGAICVVGKPLS